MTHVGRGTFDGDVLAPCNLPTPDCIAASAGECACLAHAVDECI